MSESGPSIDESIRPGLQQAYPLPAMDHDERFQLVLEALAQVGRRQSDHDPCEPY